MTARRGKAPILGRIIDEFGDEWDVRLRVLAEPPKGDPLPLHQGWPHGHRRGKGGVGGASWILTRPLIDWLERVRFDALANLAGMPFGKNALKRLRKAVGHDRAADRRAWWVERLDDLQSLPSAEFAARHPRDGKALSAGAVDLMRAELVGPRGRIKGGWRAHAELILGGLPAQLVGERLGVPAAVASRWRYRLRQERGAPSA